MVSNRQFVAREIYYLVTTTILGASSPQFLPCCIGDDKGDNPYSINKLTQVMNKIGQIVHSKNKLKPKNMYSRWQWSTKRNSAATAD